MVLVDSVKTYLEPMLDEFRTGNCVSIFIQEFMLPYGLFFLLSDETENIKTYGIQKNLELENDLVVDVIFGDQSEWDRTNKWGGWRSLFKLT